MADWWHDFGLFISAVLSHWQALATGGIVTAIVNVYERKRKDNLSWRYYVCILTCFCLYSVFAAWQDEHVATAIALSEKSVMVKKSESCSSDLKTANGSLEDKKSLITTLQTTFATSQGTQQQLAANVTSCLDMISKLNPAIKGRRVVAAYNDRSDDTRKLYDWILFILTNQDEPKAAGTLNCDENFELDAEPEIVTPSRGFQSSPAIPLRISKHGFYLNFMGTSSRWSPTTPIFLQIRTTTATRPICSFDPQ